MMLAYVADREDLQADARGAGYPAPLASACRSSLSAFIQYNTKKGMSGFLMAFEDEQADLVCTIASK